MSHIRIKPLFKWFDMWVGVFVDTKQRRIYILPIPCIGVVIEWGDIAGRAGRAGRKG